MTILRRDLCYTNGVTFKDDVSIAEPIPSEIIHPVSVDMVGHGVLDGYLWVECHHTHDFSKIACLLFFWLIKPKKELRLFVSLNDGGKIVEFDYQINESKTIFENLSSAPESLGVKSAWIKVD